MNNHVSAAISLTKGAGMFNMNAELDVIVVPARSEFGPLVFSDYRIGKEVGRET
jgi:hypothetical protein